MSLAAQAAHADPRQLLADVNPGQRPTPSNVRDSNRIPSQSDFTACVDRCVNALLSVADPTTSESEPAQAQLRALLHDGPRALDDGTPIDFALFDSAILSVAERLPAAGALAQSRLLRAARLLAEAVYSKSANMPRVAAET